ncbi:anthranilate phosphoribosyltransferase [Reichenbachiella agariperforans]|uniref:anthranilate phosphoribosyltransferase n=1 Tax=Reichenbachiella agariperforans TaxID=156994 RepID=UPI001C0972FE|nr:anthranilate phosphoribosyltransferase [Reichenbachiella agariperforans]MBU2914743.1 anthranilate phosphoribosyltransferase [Reichenbachiella agariperforans]
MKELLEKLTGGYVLPKAEAQETLMKLAQGEYNPSQLAAFLTIYRMRGIQAHELSGFKDAMLALCHAIDLSAYDAMDMCGTGGDGKDTFNISTTSSFVVAGAGQMVSKHGNNSVSSNCGSSNLLSHFGYEFTAEESVLQRSMETAGICFLHAPLFHPAMKNVAPVRRDLGIKTFFNMLGPLVNPSKPAKQLMGVYSLEVAQLYQDLHREEGRDCAIVHAVDGYDEISLTGDFKVYTKDEILTFSPEDVGLKRISPAAIHGGETVADSAKIFEQVLKGEATAAQTDVVLANAGLALYMGQGLGSFEEGIAKAKESIDSGAAYQCFKKFIQVGK